MDGGDEGDAAFEVGSEVGVIFAVLGGGAVAETVGEDGFEFVEGIAADIGLFVDGKAGKVLANAEAHDAGFAVIDGEAFLGGDSGDVGGETIDTAGEGGIAGEREVIGVSGIDGPRGFGESGESAIETIGAEVGEGRRGGRTLRQMGGAVEGFGATLASWVVPSGVVFQM